MLFHLSVDLEILHSTSCEELSRGTSLHHSILPELVSIGINIAADDVLLNLVTKDTQLMRGPTPWRGGREKDPILLQMLIESITHAGDIVFDCTTSTGKDFLSNLLLKAFLFIHIFLHIPCFNSGASVHACWKAGCHFVAMEADQMIFKAILEPLIVASIPKVLMPKKRLDAQRAFESLVDEEIADTVIEACNRFYK